MQTTSKVSIVNIAEGGHMIIAQASEPNTPVQVNTQLTPALYEALRLRAYQQHTSMAEIMRLALAAYLAGQDKVTP